jgi:hypothetical protein
MESFEKARSDAYDLPRQRVRDSNGNLAFPLSADYEQSARHAVKEQLAKAGMRLAFVLNESLR